MNDHQFENGLYDDDENLHEEEVGHGFSCRNIYEKMEELKKLRNWGKKLDWQSEKERLKLLRYINELIVSYTIDHHLNLREIFRPEEIDFLLMDSIKSYKYRNEGYPPTLFVGFVANSGYKDDPESIDKALSSRRTTAIHWAGRHWLPTKVELVRDLFRIFNRYDVNYVDDWGLTHLHVACMEGHDNAVRKFLAFGHDPNCIMSETGDTPLNVALIHGHKTVAELLLRNGSDPNVPGDNGSVPLHMICISNDDVYLVDKFFEICQERHLSVRVNAQDKQGRSPLHLALTRNHKRLAELLLKNGADPNLTDAQGLTALHTICKNTCEDGLTELFFKMCEGTRYRAEVDAVDMLGLTPLEWAVANLLPTAIDVLIDHGANLSTFVFPSAHHFVGRLESELGDISINFKLRLASGLIGVVERLVKRGYEMEDNDTLTIMGLFDKFNLFQKSMDFEKFLTDDEEFVKKAKDLMVKPNMSLYDLTQLRPKEATKQLSIMDYYNFANTEYYWFLPARTSQACGVHLCEKISRGFFLRCALDSLIELIHNRLPILCCHMIMDQLNNEDLRNIFMATAGRSS